MAHAGFGKGGCCRSFLTQQLIRGEPVCCRPPRNFKLKSLSETCVLAMLAMALCYLKIRLKLEHSTLASGVGLLAMAFT